MARKGGGCGSPRMEMLSPLRTLRDALARLPSISTLPCCSSNCTRERLTSPSCWARKRSRRWPLASSGTVSRRKRASSSAMGDLRGLGRCSHKRPPRAPSPRHQLRDRDKTSTAAVAAQEGKQEAGEAAQEKPRTQDFSIVMRAMQQPQQQHEQHELDQAGVELGGVQGHSQRGSGHGAGLLKTTAQGRCVGVP
jgi:hypothetical protein